MGYLVIALLIIVVSAVVNFLALNNEKKGLIGLGATYLAFAIIMPSSIKEAIMLVVDIAMGRDDQAVRVILGFIIFLILFGMILGVMIRYSLRIKLAGKNVLDYIVSITAIIVVAFTLIWLVQFIADLVALSNYQFTIPQMYPLTLWLIVSIVVLAISLFSTNGVQLDGLSTGLALDKVSIPGVNSAANSIEREADIVLYQNDLTSLDTAVKAGTIKKDRYARIICDIELLNVKAENVETTTNEL